MSDLCLEFKDLMLGYQSRAAVHHLSGRLKSGSLTAMVGTRVGVCHRKKRQVAT